MAIQIDGAGTITGVNATGISAQPVFPGQVLQVVQEVSATFTSTTSTSLVTTNISASITPTSASSKIFVFVTWTSQINSTGVCNFEIRRGTVSGSSLSASRMGSPSGNVQMLGSMSYLDAPNTTSSQTYTLGFFTNGVSAFVSPGGETSVITLMEIAG